MLHSLLNLGNQICMVTRSLEIVQSSAIVASPNTAVIWHSIWPAYLRSRIQMHTADHHLSISLWWASYGQRLALMHLRAPPIGQLRQLAL